MPNSQGIYSTNELEQKRIRRAAAANLRLEQKLAQRLRPVEDCHDTLSSTVQESFAHLLSESEQASKSEGAVALQSGAVSAQGELLTIQSAQSGLSS